MSAVALLVCMSAPPVELLRKMGCTRQAEVTALLVSVALVPEATPASGELQKE